MRAIVDYAAWRQLRTANAAREEGAPESPGPRAGPTAPMRTMLHGSPYSEYHQLDYIVDQGKVELR